MILFISIFSSKKSLHDVEVFIVKKQSFVCLILFINEFKGIAGKSLLSIKH